MQGIRNDIFLHQALSEKLHKTFRTFPTISKYSKANSKHSKKTRQCLHFCIDFLLKNKVTVPSQAL